MLRLTFLAAVLALVAFYGSTPARAGDTPISKRTYLYIGWPNNGEVIRSRKFRMWFGLRNAGVAPAGVEKPNTGHHHLIIDDELPPFDEPIPFDKDHLHFGAGQTQAVIELPPGKHTLQLLFGDHSHIPHKRPVFSKRITVTVAP